MSKKINCQTSAQKTSKTIPTKAKKSSTIGKEDLVGLWILLRRKLLFQNWRRRSCPSWRLLRKKRKARETETITVRGFSSSCWIECRTWISKCCYSGICNFFTQFVLAFCQLKDYISMLTNISVINLGQWHTESINSKLSFQIILIFIREMASLGRFNHTNQMTALSLKTLFISLLL